jgi:integrase
MWMVKVRILPPQPKFPRKFTAKTYQAKLLRLVLRIRRASRNQQYLFKEETRMGRKKEITLYQLVNTPEGNRYARMVKTARGWAQAKPLEGEPGSYYLRLHKNGKPTFESVGKDLANAVQEMKDRKEALSKPSLVVTALKPKVTSRKAVADFLKMKETKNWQHQLGVFADWYGWERDPGELQRSDFKAYARHVESLGLRPRTEKNYLSNLCTFLRWTGRVVLVAGTEQDATLAKAGAVIANTLVLVSNDFPTVNQGIPDYYSEAQVKALFGAAKNLWEKTALACFYYTGAREEEVSHLTWKDVRWEENEILVREKPEFEWTTKTFQDREVVVHDALIEILREAYEVTNDPTRYHAEGWTFFGKSKLIFPNINGKPEGHFLSKIQRIAYRAGVVCGDCENCLDHKGRNCHDFGLHKFRYTAARVMDEGKTPIKDIKEALGHKDITTTDRYLGGGNKKQRRANVRRSWKRIA